MAKTLFYMIGLPGSGKSTKARQMLAEYGYGNIHRVNKDDLRAMMDDGHHSSQNEKFVLLVRDYIVVETLGHGKHVIVDDTGFSTKHQNRLKQLAHDNGAAFEIVDFTGVSIETCIERDLKRLHSVGEAVIRKMWRDFLQPTPPVIERNPDLPDAIICDIDGTVALMDGRSPYDYSLVRTDLPNVPVVDLVNTLSDQNNAPQIIFVSGRKSECREATQAWLLDYFFFEYPLFMRADGDDRDDRIVKEEIYRREIEGKYNVLFVLDDRNRTVAKWRELGLTCFQVAPGDF